MPAPGALRSALRSTSLGNERPTSPRLADARSKRPSSATPRAGRSPMVGAEARASNVRATSAQSAASSPDGENDCPGRARRSNRHRPSNVCSSRPTTPRPPHADSARASATAAPPAHGAISFNTASRAITPAACQHTTQRAARQEAIDSEVPAVRARHRTCPRVRHPLDHCRATVQPDPSLHQVAGNLPASQQSHQRNRRTPRAQRSAGSEARGGAGGGRFPSGHWTQDQLPSADRIRLHARRADSGKATASAALQLPWRRMITDAPGRRCSARQAAQVGGAPLLARVGAQRVKDLQVATAVHPAVQPSCLSALRCEPNVRCTALPGGYGVPRVSRRSRAVGGRPCVRSNARRPSRISSAVHSWRTYAGPRPPARRSSFRIVSSPCPRAGARLSERSHSPDAGAGHACRPTPGAPG